MFDERPSGSGSRLPNIERRKLLAYAAFGSAALAGVAHTEAASTTAQRVRFEY